VPSGADLLLLIGSANRDPDMFTDPECFDIRRENAREHISFGHGAHFCLGAPLARLEARVVLEELTRVCPKSASCRVRGCGLLPNAHQFISRVELSFSPAGGGIKVCDLS
jgi:hypothetical protein